MENSSRANLNTSCANETFDACIEIVTSASGSSVVYTTIPDNLRATYYIISVVGFILNSFTVAVIFLHKPMRKHLTSAFIANQSLIDAAASVFVFFSTIYQNDLVRRKKGNLADEILCRVWFTQVPMYAMFVSSIYGIVALTFERFLAVVHPLWHKAHFRGKKLIAIFISVWLSGTVYYLAAAVPSSALDNYGLCNIYALYSSQATQYLYTVVDTFVIYLIPLGCLVFFYYKMSITLRGSVLYSGGSEAEQGDAREIETAAAWNRLGIQENIDANGRRSDRFKTQIAIISTAGAEQHDEAISGTNRSIAARPGLRAKTSGQTTRKRTQYQTPNGSASTLKARQNIFKTLVIVGVGFVLCYTWTTIYFLMYHFGYPVDFNGEFFNFTVAMTYLGCCINPIIYCIQYRPFQRAVSAVLRGRQNAVSTQPEPQQQADVPPALAVRPVARDFRNWDVKHVTLQRSGFQIDAGTLTTFSLHQAVGSVAGNEPESIMSI